MDGSESPITRQLKKPPPEIDLALYLQTGWVKQLASYCCPGGRLMGLMVSLERWPPDETAQGCTESLPSLFQPGIGHVQ